MSEPIEQGSDRYCPICEQWMTHESCPTDEVPTIRRDCLEEQSTYIPEGTILGGRYRVIRLIGVGGMGEVYLGTQSNMDRRVALKTLKKEFMSNERLLKRFYREARAAAALDHPNIVKVYDFGLDPDQGCPYIAMEYLEGVSLDSLIESEGRLSETRACLIVGAVARALTDAHSKGVVHRDLKPDNVHVQSLTDGTEHVKVLDFGIAKIRRPDGTPTEKLTGTGMALGTPYYMSPEQAMGKPADFRSDLYSLGCIIYQLLSGRIPFDAEQPMAILFKQLRDPAPALPARLCDGKPPTDVLRHLYASLMAKNPEERPVSTLAVADRLHECVKLSSGEGGDKGKPGFEFGNLTLGPKRKRKPLKVDFEPGLETLVSSSMGEKSTLAFGAIDESESITNQAGANAASDGEFDAVKRRRLKPMVMAALVLLVGGASAYVLSGQAPSKEDSQVTRKATVPVVKVSLTQVSVTSKPPGATVMNGQRLLGVTPLNAEINTSDLPSKLSVSLDGHTTKTTVVTVGKTTVSVELKKKHVPVEPAIVTAPVDTKNAVDSKSKVAIKPQPKPAKDKARAATARKRSRPRRGLRNVKPTTTAAPSRAVKPVRKARPNKRPKSKKSDNETIMEPW